MQIDNQRMGCADQMLEATETNMHVDFIEFQTASVFCKHRAEVCAMAWQFGPIVRCFVCVVIHGLDPKCFKCVVG